MPHVWLWHSRQKFSHDFCHQSQRTYVTLSVWQRAICYNLWWFYNIWSVSHWVELGKSASGNVYKIKSVLWRGLSDGIFNSKSCDLIPHEFSCQGSADTKALRTVWLVRQSRGVLQSHDPRYGRSVTKIKNPSWSFPLCVFGKFKFF